MTTITNKKYTNLSNDEMLNISGGKKYLSIECIEIYSAEGVYQGLGTQRVYTYIRANGSIRKIENKEDQPGDVAVC